MRSNQAIVSGLTVLLMAMNTSRSGADDKVPVMKNAYVQASGVGFLVLVDGEITFQKRLAPGTLWNVGFRKDGFWIVNAKTGKLLGIDAKKKELVLFDEPGPTTTWQFKSTGVDPKLNDAFKVLLFMKVGDEELCVSADDLGNPILGGKAALLLFDLWSP